MLDSADPKLIVEANRRFSRSDCRGAIIVRGRYGELDGQRIIEYEHYHADLYPHLRYFRVVERNQEITHTHKCDTASLLFKLRE
jgi:hypothetical protein